MEDEMNQSIDSLIDILHKVHCDNSRQQYYADIGGRRVSIMPLTPFVYEYFLFNSIYQVNWHKSYEKGELTYHSREEPEFDQQKELIKHLKEHAKKHPSDLYRAFEPLVYLPIAEGDWTMVAPDSRISETDGERFFKKIKTMQGLIEECVNPGKMPTSNKVFDLIREGALYIYLVRNNIFHGSKTLGDIYKKNQKLRIEVYELFLKGITSLFFLSAGKRSVASDIIPCPVSTNSLPISRQREMLDQNTVRRAINKRVMKIGDSRLISEFIKRILPPKNTPSEKSALFYPSSNIDMLTPLLLGLPYCTQFYFYERGQGRNAPPILSILRNIPVVRIDNRPRSPRWEHRDNAHYFDFEYDGIPRRIHWIHMDNLEFLKLDVELGFYFHRGDSWGEGGSGQLWDSEHLPELIDKIPADKRCMFLTDGEPGGIDTEYFESCGELSIPYLDSGRKYYFGFLANHMV